MGKANAQTGPTKSDVAGSLPSGWRMVRFDEIAQSIGERVEPGDADTEYYVGLEHLDTDSLKIRRWGKPEDVEATKLRFRAGDIIFGKRRVYQRKLAVAEFDGICSAHAMVIRAREAAVEKDFLPFFMQSDMFMERALAISVGSLSPTINWSVLRRQEFPLPPKDEQRRIAEILWAAEEALQGAVSVWRSLQSLLRASILEAIRGTATTGNGNAGYTKVPLGSLFHERRETGFPHLPILSVTIDGRVVRREALERRVIDKTGNDKYLRVVTGDLAYNTMRMWQGSCGIVQEEGIISPAYTVLTPQPQRADARYWHFAFHTPEMLEWFRRYSTGVAADRWRLYYRDFAKIQVHTPPLEKQESLAKVFVDFERQIATAREHVDNTAAMTRSLINSMTVPIEME